MEVVVTGRVNKTWEVYPIKDRFAMLHVSRGAEKGEPQLQNKRGKTYYFKM